MDRFKQRIADLEKDLAQAKAAIAEINGSPQSKTDVHYVTCNKEFGEYSLSEIDTFRFKVTRAGNFYNYTLTNPTPELIAYLKLQHRVFTSQWIQVEPSAYEEFCMSGNTPFVLTTEIRKCLESKLWEFAGTEVRKEIPGIKPIFTTDVIIPFTHIYEIPPHISYYITPLQTLDLTIELKEITRKRAILQINYGNTTPYKETDALKLHYAIYGIAGEELPCLNSDEECD